MPHHVMNWHFIGNLLPIMPYTNRTQTLLFPCRRNILSYSHAKPSEIILVKVSVKENEVSMEKWNCRTAIFCIGLLIHRPCSAHNSNRSLPMQLPTPCRPSVPGETSKSLPTLALKSPMMRTLVFFIHFPKEITQLCVESSLCDGIRL